jgi:Virus neck protein
MPTNVYFNNFNSKPEQRLYDDLINETIKQYGIDSFYIPRSSGSAVDLIFGDDPTKTFTSAYPVEVYVKNVDNFEGQELFSKFGLEIQHQMRFLMTTRAFSARVPSTYARPLEGDLLWLPNFQALFEIKFTNQQHFFYAFGNRNFYGFELVCERFRYNNEVVTTGQPDVDNAVNLQTTAYQFIMQSGGSLSYSQGEPIYQGSSLGSATAAGVVSSWNLPSLTLEVKQIKGVFAVGTPIIGANTGASFVLNTSNLYDNANDLSDNNDKLRTEGDMFLDFSESNPFGQPE